MFYRACEKRGERWLIGEASSCTCPADKPQEQRIAELEALNEDLYRQGVGFIARIAELEAALDVALEALEKHSTSLLNHEDEYAEAIAKLKEVRGK